MYLLLVVILSITIYLKSSYNDSLGEKIVIGMDSAILQLVLMI